MATRKAPASSSSSRALTVWEQKMAASAAKVLKTEKVTGGLQGISFQGGVITIDEKPVKGNSLDVVILLSVHENQYFTQAYDPNRPATPACYAFGDPDADDPEAGMAPHSDVEDKQHADCATCPLNKMGSADVGRGKACKNVRRMAVIMASDLESPDSLAEAEVRAMKVPVMSTKGWAQYARMLAEDMKRPYWSVVTRVAPVPDKKSQFRVTFEFVELIDFTDKLFAALEKKIAEIKPQMIAPYPKFTEEDEDEAPPARKTPAKKATAAAPVKATGRAAQAMAKSASRSKF